MKVVTGEEMQRIDRRAVREMGIPAEVLMGFAGRWVADFILERVAEAKRVAVFSGPGNNGGDGFVIAYLLANRGVGVEVFIAGEAARIAAPSRIFLDLCAKSSVPVREITGRASLEGIDMASYDLIVDSLLGTGFKGTARGVMGEIIEVINESRVKVLAVDVPSGLPSGGEAPEGSAVRADYTVTMGLPKLSLVTWPGMEYAGSLHVADIGFPRNLTDSPELRVEMVDREYAKARLAVRRDRDAHKGSAGHLLLVGGFDHMEGAIILSALAAFQAGVGLATVLSTERARGIIAGVVPELITRSLRPEGGSGAVITAGEGEGALRKGIEEGLDAFFAEDRRYDAAVIGPGMGRGPFSRLVFEAFMGRAAGSKVKRVVVDGDGLYHLAALKKRGSRGKEAQVIITPHFAEASRLCGRAVDEIKRDRPRAAVELARETGAVALLKGPASIVSDGEYSLVNSTGNPALATAGSGDVLAGIIGALLLRELPPLEAAGLGAYIHGLAADLCVERSRLEILKATDILGCIREAVRRTVDDAGTL